MADNLGAKDKIKAVALDFDGVMARLDVDWTEVIRKVSKELGYDVKSVLTFYRENFGTPVFQKISLEIEKTEVEAAKKAQPTPHLKEFLDALGKRQIDVFIVSMQTQKGIAVFLENHGLTQHFKEIITRDKLPDKRAQVEYAAKKTVGKLLFVDDLKRNIASCQDLDILSYYFPRDPKADEAKKAWGKILELIE
jgi:phosphoglycolate phosphatase-like HAD superfamily hydrolase